MRTIYSGASEERVTGTDYLEKRLEINKTYASADFDSWLFERLKVRPGEDVLDVGCGSGAQTIPFSKFVQPGVNECDVEAEFAHEFIRQRGKFAYNPIIAAGANAAACNRMLRVK